MTVAAYQYGLLARAGYNETTDANSTDITETPMRAVAGNKVAPQG